MGERGARSCVERGGGARCATAQHSLGGCWGGAGRGRNRLHRLIPFLFTPLHPLLPQEYALRRVESAAAAPSGAPATPAPPLREGAAGSLMSPPPPPHPPQAVLSSASASGGSVSSGGLGGGGGGDLPYSSGPALAAACAQEAAYNTGRAAHLLGLNHIASHCYLQALHPTGGGGAATGTGRAGPAAAAGAALEEAQAGPVGRTAAAAGASAGGQQGGQTGEPGGTGEAEEAGEPGPLVHEAAHNLAMIYVASGAGDLAREVYRRFMVI